MKVVLYQKKRLPKLPKEFSIPKNPARARTDRGDPVELLKSSLQAHLRGVPCVNSGADSEGKATIAEL